MHRRLCRYCRRHYHLRPPPRGEVGDDGKEPGNLGVPRPVGGGERRVGYDKPLDGVVLLNGRVCKVVDLNDNRVAHLHLRVLVSHAVVCDACEPDELMLLEEGPAPHRLPTYPGLLVVGNMHPPAPHVIYATVRYGMLGTCSDYGSLGDGYLRVLSHILAEFLLADVDGDIAAGIDGLVEGVEVGIDLGLQYCCLVFHEVVTDVADGDPVEALVGVLKCDKKSFVKRGGTNVDGDAAGEDTILPVEVQYLVF